MLEVKKISKQYGDKIILRELSYSFKTGKIYGIIGPNGAGKSTFLRTLGGFEKPDKGEITLNGKPLKEPSPLVACMWQKPYFFTTTVAENIAYGLKVRGLSPTDIQGRVKDILEKFKLEHLADTVATKISGGEGARVALARTIACGSPIVILDEPAANLDPLNTRLMEETLLKVQREENLTIIIVTHDMFQGKRLAHYTLFMEDGLIKEARETKKLFSNPENPSTRDFLQGII